MFDPIVQLTELSKRYASGTWVLDKLDLQVEAKDFKVIFGLPGCGKSVLMRIILGLERPNGGKVSLRGKEITNINPGEHNIGYIPQSFALFPHQTVYENIAYPLVLQRLQRETIHQEVLRVSKLLAIEELLEKKPAQTSGGQKQRIAIARGLAKKTDLYIFDDPFVGLDFKLREQLVYDLRDLQEKLDTTFIYTTSDSTEALQLSKSISILHQGKIIESNDPITLYQRPNIADSMRLLGFPGANMLHGKMLNGILTTEAFACQGISIRDGDVIAGIRPEHFSFGDGQEGTLSFEAKIVLCEDLGGEEIVYFETRGITMLMMVWHHDEVKGLEIDKVSRIHVKKADIICFDADTQARL